MRGLVALNPTQVTVVAVNEDAGVAGTQYYNTGISDKGLAIVHILEDIMDEFIQNNAARIGRFIAEAEEAEEEYGEEEDPDE